MINVLDIKEGKNYIIVNWVNQPNYIGDFIKIEKGVLTKTDKKGFISKNFDKRYLHYCGIKLIKKINEFK